MSSNSSGLQKQEMRNVGGGQAWNGQSCVEIVPQGEWFLGDFWLSDAWPHCLCIPHLIFTIGTQSSLHWLITCLTFSRLQPNWRMQRDCRGHRWLFMQHAFPTFPTNRAPVLASDFHTPQGKLTPSQAVRMGLTYWRSFYSYQALGQHIIQLWSMRHERSSAVGSLGRGFLFLWNYWKK